MKFSESHLECAAELFTRRYIKTREKIDMLPSKYMQKNVILPLMHELCEKSLGVVAVENHKVIGYLMGFPISNFKGTQRGIYCPEWAHAVICDERPFIYQKLYEKASVDWIQRGCLNHAITIMAEDEEAINTWFWNGFGLHVVDSVRDLDSLPGEINHEVDIRKCEKEDIEKVVKILFEYKKYMSCSPTYLPLLHVDHVEDITKWLENPDNTIWLGLSKENIIAIMEVSYKKSNDAQILSDDETVSIGVTYIVDDFRGKGIGKALLLKVIEEAYSKGYKRCAVVFESQNSNGKNFWLKYFKPVCYSLVRKVDDRINCTSFDL